MHSFSNYNKPISMDFVGDKCRDYFANSSVPSTLTEEQKFSETRLPLRRPTSLKRQHSHKDTVLGKCPDLVNKLGHETQENR